VALLTLHHIASDGWSMGLLVAEVGALYAAPVAGAGAAAGGAGALRAFPALPSLPVQYGDYARWQRDWLHGEVLAREVARWQERLRGVPGVLELPLDRSRRAVRGESGGSVEVVLERELGSAVVGLGRSQGATAFMVLMAGWQALLGRLSGQEALCVGTPVAGRHRLETERLIGFFVNTLVLRGAVGGELSFAAHLSAVREESLWAYEHQDVPFEKLVEELSPERSLSHAPLFQVMFVLQNAPRGSLELAGLTWRHLELEAPAAKFDLSLTLG
jgi:hypothetical protein